MTLIDWKTKLRPFARASKWRAWIQIVNTVLPYIALIVLMGFLMSINVHPLWIILLSIPTGLFLVRIFILFHDCTHQSFFASKKWNTIAGYIFGIMTFTPYRIWQAEHNRHHGAVGNLDRRGTGDVWTMTVEEYVESSGWKRFVYRIYRNPFFLFVIAPFFLFAVLHRLPSRNFKGGKYFVSRLVTNAALLAIFLLVTFTLGINYYLLIQLPVLFVASVSGVWLFFIQHQFEEVYWEHHEDWDFVKAAIEGSSFYKLPLVLDWMTGHIGFHHIHHLNSRIPNYRLRQSYRAVQNLKNGKTITLLESFKLGLYKLYDEKTGRLVRMRDVKRI